MLSGSPGQEPRCQLQLTQAVSLLQNPLPAARPPPADPWALPLGSRQLLRLVGCHSLPGATLLTLTVAFVGALFLAPAGCVKLGEAGQLEAVLGSAPSRGGILVSGSCHGVAVSGVLQIGGGRGGTG